MGLITDINSIEKLAAEKDEQNWRFRCFVKASDMEIEELDAIVHEIYEKVAAQIDCQTCGNCCKAMHPILKPKDIKRLASRFSMSKGEFVRQYLVESVEDGERGIRFRKTPCPFLSGNSCTVYSARPGDCRSYPHLHKKEFVFRIGGVLSNCSVCPIVYNVYELLKHELHRLEIESFSEDYEYENNEQPLCW